VKIFHIFVIPNKTKMLNPINNIEDMNLTSDQCHDLVTMWQEFEKDELN